MAALDNAETESFEETGCVADCLELLPVLAPNPPR